MYTLTNLVNLTSIMVMGIPIKAIDAVEKIKDKMDLCCWNQGIIDIS